MRTIKIDGMVTNIETCRCLAIKSGKGARRVRVVAMNGYACFVKQGRTYQLDVLTKRS
jgi:hypothetical protein